MKLTVLKDEKDELHVEFDEVDHGLLNMIKEALWQQSGVEIASFRIEHPEISKPVFILKTKGKEAKKVWNAAMDALSDELASLDKELKKL